MKRNMLIMAMLLAIPLVAQAQEAKLEVKPSGRILFDAAYLHPQYKEDEMRSGVGIPDVRVGVGFSYGKWKGKIDMGYAYGKVGIKDVYVQYNFDKQNFLRGGYFIHQYGYQSCTSSSFKETMEEPQSNAAFNNDRVIGLMYEHSEKNFLATVSAIVENDAMKQTTDVTGSEGIGALTRLVWHPHTERGNIFHVGISGGIQSARYSSDSEMNHKQFTLSSNWPTRVSKVKAQQAVVTEAKAMYMFSPEILFSKGRFAAVGQYFLNKISRRNDLDAFNGSGAYITLRGIIKGDAYKYTMNDGGIDTPDPGIMELVFQYNYTSLSDTRAKIYGGYLNDWTLGYDYYINKYMIWRVRASWTRVTNRAEYENNELWAIETRLQVKF